MAPTTYPCPAAACEFVSSEAEPAVAIQLLQLHDKHEHALVQQPPQVGGQAAGQAKPRAEKVPRPQIKLGVSQDEFSYFQDEWTSYKRSCGITDETETRDQLRAACNEDLRRNLFNCLGSKLKTLTEQQMMDEIKKLAVLAQNNLVKMVQFFALSQDREEPIRAFFARLKAGASACELSVQCTAVACTEKVSYADKMILHALVRGIVDEEIRENVLAKSEELGLEETVKFVEAKETGRRSTVELGTSTLANTAVSKITTYKREQKSGVITKPKEILERGVQCKYCKTGHNVNDANYSREEECPAWNNKCHNCQRLGHFTRACTAGKPKVSSITQSQKEEQFDAELLAVHVNQLVDSRLVDSRRSSSDRGARCKFCSQTGHGYIPPPNTRRRECPASGETCQNCQKRGHLAKACRSHRRFVKVIPPPIRQVGANYDAQLSDRTSDEDSDDVTMITTSLSSNL